MPQAPRGALSTCTFGHRSVIRFERVLASNGSRPRAVERAQNGVSENGVDWTGAMLDHHLVPRRQAALAVLVTIAASSACGARPSPRPPERLLPVARTPNPSRVSPAVAAACVPLSATGADGWVHYTLCSPIAPWQGSSNAPPAVSDGSVPASLVDARQRLVALGVADVTGAELRDVEIVTYDVWGATEPARGRGLVLPALPGETRYVFFPPGLVWPVHAMGPRLDLVAECTRALDLHASAVAVVDDDRARWNYEEQSYAACPIGWAWPLLLAAGRPDLAGRAAADSAQHSADALVSNVLQRLLYALFERAVTHYMQGEDAIARADAEAIGRMRPIAAALGAPVDELRDLDAAEPLRSELERRATTRPRPPLALPPRGPVDAALIPRLIDALEDVNERQFGQPGGVSLESDARVVALIRVGEAAVPALLDCMENDRRLTRSVHFWRDFARSRHVLGVHEACYVALANIVDQSFFELVATGDDLSSRDARDRARVAAAARAYWARWGGMTPLERRRVLLMDDNATPDEWAGAAQWLVSPAAWTDASRAEADSDDDDNSRALAGEPLRTTQRAAILSTMISRARAAQGVEGWVATCALLGAAVVWAGEPTPRPIGDIALACTHAAACECKTEVAGELGHAFEDVALAWLANAELVRYADGDTDENVSTLRSLLDVPSVAGLADRRLRAVPIDVALTRELAMNPSNVLERVWQLVDDGMPGAVAFLDRLLASRRPAGRLSMEPPSFNSGPIPMVLYRGGGSSVELREPFVAPRALRVCDLAAGALALHLGVGFSLTWDAPQRAAAITEMRRELEQRRAAALRADTGVQSGESREQ